MVFKKYQKRLGFNFKEDSMLDRYI
jgi:hypothetical protein